MLKFIPDTWCLILGEEDQEEVKASEEDYATLRAKGIQIAKENPALKIDLGEMA
jgi:hypothetical protein